MPDFITPLVDLWNGLPPPAQWGAVLIFGSWVAVQFTRRLAQLVRDAVPALRRFDPIGRVALFALPYAFCVFCSAFVSGPWMPVTWESSTGWRVLIGIALGGLTSTLHPLIERLLSMLPGKLGQAMTAPTARETAQDAVFAGAEDSAATRVALDATTPETPTSKAAMRAANKETT